MPSLALKMNRCENDTKLVFAWGITLDLCDIVAPNAAPPGQLYVYDMCFKCLLFQDDPKSAVLERDRPAPFEGTEGFWHLPFLSLKDLAIDDKK